MKVPGLLESQTGPAPPDGGSQPAASTLTVDIVSARSASGKPRVALFHDAAGFPEASSNAVRRQEVDIDASTLSAHAVFPNVPPGIYAVSVVHDENMNGKLDKNFLRIPSEGYGTSNNPGKKLRAPRFDEAEFVSKAADQTVGVKLVY